MRTLFLVNDIEEARQSLKVFDDRRDVIMSLSLEAEFYLQSEISTYKNLLYEYLDISGPTCSYNFLIPHFKAAYDFARGLTLDGIRDRLGYFFSDFDRSLGFAEKVINDLMPDRIVSGSLKKYPGSSIINGSLKIHAFDVISREKKIVRKSFSRKTPKKSLRQILGEFSNKIITLKSIFPSGSYDLVILAPPRHIFQLGGLIKKLKKSNLNVLTVTYTLTPSYRRKLSRQVGKYYEKEMLITADIKKGSEKLLREVIKLKIWNEFFHPKFKSRNEVQKFLRDKIKNVIYYELLENLKDKIISEKFFAMISTSALLTTTDPDSKVIHFIMAARKNNIKTLALQHGVMWSPSPPSVVPVSDSYITWSETSRSWVNKIAGFEKVNVLVGQSPFHNKLKMGRAKRSEVIKILYLVTIVIMDNNMVAYYQKRLFDILEKFNGQIKITVRIHPFQDKVNLSALVNNSRLNVSFDKNESLQKSIEEADLVIFEETTAGFDAMLARKPTIFFNPFSGEDYFEVEKNEYSMIILSEKDITDKLLFFLNSRHKWEYYAKRGKAFATEYLGITNPSGKRLAGVIVSQLKK